MLSHIELEAVESVAILVIEVEIPVPNIDAGPIVKAIRNGSSEDRDEIGSDAEAAELGRPGEGPLAAHWRLE